MSDRLTEERLKAIRAEIRDKLAVVHHSATSTPLQRSVVLQQCEEFLVEQFQSEVYTLTQQLAERDQQIAALTQERDNAVQFLGERTKDEFDRAERAEHELATLREGMEQPGLTLRKLSETNLSRARRWHPGGLSEWSPLEWAGAMAGEAGEACNAAKKLKRIDGKIANINLEDGRSLTDQAAACQQIGKEVADTIIYGVLLAQRVGVDIEQVIVGVFNAKSEEYGFPERLSANQPPQDSQEKP